MAVDLDHLLGLVDEYMDKAADADELDQTVYYSNKGLAFGLAAITTALIDLNKTMLRIEQKIS